MLKQLIALAGLFLFVLGSVNAQQRQDTEIASNTTMAPKQEETTSVASTTEGETTSVSNAPAVLAGEIMNALRREIERRRTERQKLIDERRENILKNLDNLSDRRRDYELRRLEKLQTSEEQRTARRDEVEARRVGRIPAREQKRIIKLRQERLLQSEPNEAENEVDGPGNEVPPKLASVIRSIVLIEEASGNVRLVDLGTEEGRRLASRVTGRVENEDERRAALAKLRLKRGQL
ncbi:uncharacterized protein LOC129723989 [Wyeomyia smithii]|uniref:uncharacterized protein LOC129723989 n=1 Tax=Wyeomyia smithii TaxID=174621 RepID=UPI002467B59A|nr:uncharacterized protein LOC129723989 [Wyeomyia smithii]